MPLCCRRQTRLNSTVFAENNEKNAKQITMRFFASVLLRYKRCDKASSAFRMARVPLQQQVLQLTHSSYPNRQGL